MIIFKKLQFKNLLSVGNIFETIELNKYSSVLICGKNGEGKSLIIDALTFALFGKPFKRINKPQLINSINKKNLEVELTFDIGSKSYEVKRGIKPIKFEIWCDGILINQDSKTRDYQKFLEESILKLNYKSFTQIVVLGSASFIPFMQLTANDRRIIIEDILDIKIFSIMKTIVKDDNVLLKEEINSINYDVNLVKEKIKIQQGYLDNLKQDKQKKIDKLNQKIKETDTIIDEKESENNSNQKISKSISNKLEDCTIKHKKLTKYNNLKFAIQKNLDNHNKKKEFYFNHDKCPTCMQIINTLFKESIVQDTKLTIDEMILALSKLDIKIIDLDSAILMNEEMLKQRNKINDKVSMVQYEINQHVKNKIEIQNEINEIILSMNNDNEDSLEDLQKEENKLLDQKNICLDDQQYTNIMLNILNDAGIKTKIINKYLPVINRRVNTYLKDMDFFANFELDEQFNETIKSRYRDEFSYNSFSEGEKKRIDIALLLTWRDIASLKNSVNINILIMDEIFDSSLDEYGVEDLMKLFGSLVNTNLFIISHRNNLLEDQFQHKIDVKKHKNFSTYTES